MRNLVNSIYGTLTGTDKLVQIELEGKNLIITGGNGCGKTRFLKQIYSQLHLYVNRQHVDSIATTKKNIGIYTEALNNGNTKQYPEYQRALNEAHENLKRLEKLHGLDVALSDAETFSIEFNSKRKVLRFFEATRQSKIEHNGTNESIDKLFSSKINEDLSRDSSVDFEKYLVSFLNTSYMAYGLRNDAEEKKKADKWFEKLTLDFQSLFEDETLSIDYDEMKMCFFINQEGKLRYRFNELSSGFSAILNIYADLLMKVELKKISAEELSGIIFIDEIDAHLHVSLQKKILSFFTNAYPNIQFIVSTHSPFVIQSVNNAVIYDLSKLEQLNDLSMYSYESITKGLLGVDSHSDLLNAQLEELANLIPVAASNKSRIEDLTKEIEPYKNKLDDRSNSFFLLAKQAIMDLDTECGK